jgi:uncharacterized protein
MQVKLFIAAFGLLVLLGQNSLSAQEVQPQAPLMGSEASSDFTQTPTPTQALPDGFGGADGVYRILIVGDTLAGGLGAGMTRIITADSGFEIVNRFNESSGLTRSEFYDWAAAIPKITASKSFDAVVVLVGVNDRQDIRDGNLRYAFRTPNWEKSYRATLDRTLAAVRLTGADVFWISLPPMASSAFDADMRYLTELQKVQTTAAGGQFIDVRPFFVAADGSYIDRGPDDTGTDRKLRSSDGVTFYKQGNNRFGQIVLGVIKDAALLPKAPASPAIASNTATPIVSTEPAKIASAAPLVAEQLKAPPLFGQAGLEGEAISFDANTVRAAVTNTPSVAVAANSAGSAQLPSAAVLAIPGSQAEKLLVEGVATQAPKGRFDDFSAPVKN